MVKYKIIKFWYVKLLVKTKKQYPSVSVGKKSILPRSTDAAAVLSACVYVVHCQEKRVEQVLPHLHLHLHKQVLDFHFVPFVIRLHICLG